MLLLFYEIGYVLFILLMNISIGQSEELSTNNVGVILFEYKNYIDASLHLDKTDRALLQAWKDDFQVKQVNTTSHYHLDMARHNERIFSGKNGNPKWRNCLSVYEIIINHSKSSYLNSEVECLKTANSADSAKVQAVHQVEKEIRKWRKSYRYLSNLCKTNYPDNVDAASLCLVEYIKRDNYDVVFQRLILLKLEAMDGLLVRLNQALSDLEECLKLSLAEFLKNIRKIMVTMNSCYNRMNKHEANQLS